MIDHYSFGSIILSGKRYTSDLKIINAEVIPDWWRKIGHSVDVGDVSDIINAKPDYVVFGSGNSGLIEVTDRLKQHLEGLGIDVIVEPTSKAVETFNLTCEEGKNVAAVFHLTC